MVEILTTARAEKWSQKIIDEVAYESGVFEMELGDGFSAEVEAEIISTSDRGGSYGSEWETVYDIVSEKYKVTTVWDEEGIEYPEIAHLLTAKLAS